MKYFLSAMKKYVVFEGRARRAEYWFFQLFYLIFILLLGFLEGVLNIAPDYEDSILALVFEFICFLPALSLSIRRMHDVNKSGWFILIPIYSFILTISEGDKGSNRYGEDPKEITTEFSYKNSYE